MSDLTRKSHACPCDTTNIAFDQNHFSSQLFNYCAKDKMSFQVVTTLFFVVVFKLLLEHISLPCELLLEISHPSLWDSKAHRYWGLARQKIMITRPLGH